MINRFERVVSVQRILSRGAETARFAAHGAVLESDPFEDRLGRSEHALKIRDETDKNIFQKRRRVSVRPSRPVAITPVIEKLREIEGTQSYVRARELEEVIEQLENKQIELEQQNRELQEAYAALEQAHDRYCHLYDESPSGYVTIDRRLMIVEANATFARQLKEEPMKLMRTSFLHRVEIPGHERFFSQLNRARKSGDPGSVEVALVTSDGGSLDVELMILPVLASAPESVTYKINVVDISERKAQQRLIEEQRSRLLSSAKLAVIGEMAANIAHEINNPLAVIVGYANALINQVSSPDFARRDRAIESATKIEQTAFRISKIIYSLQRLSRSNADEAPETVSLGSIFDDALEMCSNRREALGINLRVQPTTKALEINCRPIQIAQVMLNLLNNAIDAVKDLPEKWIEIEVEERWSSICITVRDSGLVPSAEIRTRMFDPFFTTKSVSSGSGLGLSVSRSIVASHNGILELDLSSPRTTFRMSLPKRQA